MMMKKYIYNTGTKLFLAPLLLAMSLNAGTYEEQYSVLQNTNPTVKNFNTFMDGDFEEIIRFDRIHFDGKEIDADSKNILNQSIDKIKSYVKDAKDIKVTIIGHTSEATDDANEKSIDSKTYANHIQNWFRYDLSTNESNTTSQSYALNVKDMMLDNNISQDILVVENRRGEDMAFSDATIEGRELSNRVMVTIYVIKPEDIDSDQDGVFDATDKCPGTPRGSKVDKYGCPIDSDGDGVLDYKDKCPQTPQGIKVDSEGCPLDSDRDGVVDYKDKCPDTPLSFTVDPQGCPVKKVLAINFKTDSDKIFSSSSPKIKEFADFLKNNKAYHVKIVGHTDSVGKATYNMLLSQRRALATKVALVADGVAASRLTTAGRGELDPVQSNRTKEGRSANRRIEIELSY
jgi:outer membrane protein OmpA-like peptidoglycan-associated protein